MEKVFISVGNPTSPFVLANLVEERVQPRIEIRDLAKKLRKEIAAQYKVKTPASLWWAVFLKVDDKEPVAASDNYFCRETIRKEFEENESKYLNERIARMEIAMKKYRNGSYDKEVVEILGVVCPKCGCYSVMNGYCTVCDVEEEEESSYTPDPNDWQTFPQK
jgi:hypothetical protein